MLTPESSTSKTGPGTTGKIKKDLGAASSAAAAAASDAADKLREDLGASEPLDQPSGARVVAENAKKIKQDIGAAGSELAGQAGDVAIAAQEALMEMKKIVDEFAAKTGAKASEAVETVKATGSETADHIGAALGGASSLGKEGLDGIAEAAAKRPVTAMAIALGVGLLLGLASRGGSRA